MASIAETWNPSSLQLRLALGGSNCRKLPHKSLASARPPKLGLRFRVFCVRKSGNGVESRRSWASWAGTESGADAMSGWSDSSNGQEEDSTGSRKQWSGGIISAGVAGLVLVAGLTFAASSICKQRTVGPRKEMEPLTAEQEVLLESNNQHVDGEDHIGEEKKMMPETIMPSKAAQSDDYTPDSIDAPQATSEGRWKDESGNDEEGDYLNAISNSQASPESDITDASISDYTKSFSGLDEDAPESTYESKENLASDYPTDASPETVINNFQPDESLSSGSLNFSHESVNIDHTSVEYVTGDISVSAQLETIVEAQLVPEHDIQKIAAPFEENNEQADAIANAQEQSSHSGITGSRSQSPNFSNTFSSAGIPAPSVVPEALRVSPGKVLVSPAIDQVQGQALAALQAMKVIEADVQPGDLCTRREYARWLVAASSALSRNTISKVYPAMYIENVTELAFDDITPEDPDFISIQGLAEAGLISSKLSRRDMLSSVNDDENPCYFYPESPLSRQDLVSWKMALEKKELPEADRKVLHQLSGFIDVDKINPDACPALVADFSSGDQGIIALAFGFTKLFQPEKPVTKAQAAVALATGEAADGVSEELARIEAESMAENAVAAHSALVAQVEKDVNANFGKLLSIEREKIDAVEQMAEEAKCELEKLRAKREEDNMALLMERAAVESEMEVLSRLRREVEEQLESLLGNKIEISYEKERVNQLRKDTERESQEIARLQYELEVERKALSMARAWAEDEAKRAREHAKALEEARDRWERQGIKVVVDSGLQEDASAGVTWLNAAKEEEFSVESSVARAENLMNRLKAMAATVRGKSKDIIDQLVLTISALTSDLNQWSHHAVTRAEEVKNAALVKASRSAEELQQNVTSMSFSVKEGAKRLAGDCREGVEKLTQRFKA